MTYVLAGTSIATPLLNNVDIEFTHLLVRPVPSLVAWQGKVWEYEIDRRESAVQVAVQLRKRLVEAPANLDTLKCPRSCEDCHFLHNLQRVKAPPQINMLRLVYLKADVVIEKLVDLVLYHTDISTKIVD